MRAFTASLLAFVLAFAPAAQAQVVRGRVPAPIGGLGIAPLQSAPQLTVPSLTLTAMSAPSLAAPLAAPSLTPAAVAALTVAAAPVKALASSPLPAAHAPINPQDPDKAREVRIRFDELKAAFDEKKPETAPVELGAGDKNPALLRPDAVDTTPAPNEPPRPGDKPGRWSLGFSRPLVFFLVALVLAQVGAESQTVGLPPLIAKVFGDVSAAADVGIAASLADVVGTMIAPIAAKKLGLKRGYLYSAGLRVVTSGLIAGLLAAGWLSMPGLLALMAADAMLYGISYTIEKSIPAVMLNQDQAKLEKFKAARQTAIEVVATVVPIAAGAAVAAFGFIPALVAFPVAMAAAMTLVALTLRLPAKLAALKLSPLPGPEPDGVKVYIRHLADGFKIVARTPALLYSLLAYSFVYAPTPMVYWLFAPAIALRLAGEATLSVAYAGMMTGLYSLGGIIGAVFVMRQQRKERDAAAMRTSMLRWTGLTALALVFFLAPALPALAWGTLTLPAAALLAFGVPQVIAKLKLESYFQAKAPAGAVDDATAVLEGSASLVIALGLWWAGKMLAGAHITGALWLGAAFGPLALGLLVFTWALARASRS